MGYKYYVILYIKLFHKISICINYMRFFIAFEIPEENRQELQQIQQKLSGLIPDLRLTDLNKLHLTLAFIGEQPDSLKEDLIKIITDAISKVPPFTVTPAYLDGFPTIHQPHTFWVGVSGEIDKLLLIRERIKDGLVKNRLVVDERRYIPHIAVAKPRGKFELSSWGEKDLQDFMERNHFDPIKIDSIKLFESIPDNGFHKHNTLAEIKLG